MARQREVKKISVLVPVSPFIRPDLQHIQHCLAALDVSDLMGWWPGKPHAPHRRADKVQAIQRSLDWKRVAQIASYLLQREIVGAPDLLRESFQEFYAAADEPGREWPPRVPKVIGFQPSEYPTFSNVLLHVNGAIVENLGSGKTANLVFDEADEKLNFSVIDGQHRINGAYFAVCLLQRDGDTNAKWEIPAEIFVDLDPPGKPPQRQAQIFIDVNFYQKKVDRSLVADLFPTARGKRKSLDNKERAQDLGRKLMLEIGPLVGMVQIPGIKYGVKDVVTLATLNSSIEDALDDLEAAGLRSLEAQAEFLAQCLDAWLDATGRKESLEGDSESLDGNNVAYQGRVIVSFLTLIPACIWHIKKQELPLVRDSARDALTKWLKGVMRRADLLEKELFVGKTKFKEKGYLGSGGLGRFRDALWASVIGTKRVAEMNDEEISQLADSHRARVRGDLSGQ